MPKYKTIGILGGMGPEATAEFYLRLIGIFQREYAAKYDADFPEMIILNMPIPDVVENSQDEKATECILVNGVKKLEVAEVDFIAIPCNTATYFWSAIQEAVSIPVLNTLRETANEVNRQGLRKVGLLGTEATINRNVYGKLLWNCKLIIPEKDVQKATTRIIMNILSGKKEAKDRKFLLSEIKKLEDLGAEKVILGCTDLPLLIKRRRGVIDTLDVLVMATVREAIKLEDEK